LTGSLTGSLTRQCAAFDPLGREYAQYGRVTISLYLATDPAVESITAPTKSPDLPSGGRHVREDVVDREAARTRLEGLLADLDRSASTLTAENAGGSSELSHLDQHQADTATELSDKDREDALMGVVSTQREEVVAALGRLDDGSYGRCVQCGADLPEERLEARPEASRCVACQAKAEGTRTR
jgi:DnaK suppressor protein